MYSSILFIFIYTAMVLMPCAKLFVQKGALDHSLKMILNTKRIRFCINAAFLPPRTETAKSTAIVNPLNKKARLSPG